MSINLESLNAKAVELTAKAKNVKTPEEAMAFAFESMEAIRDAKETLAAEAAKIETKDLLSFVLPFVPSQYQFAAKALLTVLGLFGGGWGFGEMIDKPDAINVTVPDETAEKLEAASKAANEAAAQQKADFDAFVASLEKQTEEIKAAANRKFILRGYDKEGRVAEELNFQRSPGN